MPVTVSDYYHSLESRIGYRLLLGNTRHFGYYDPETIWPFPLGAAMRRMEEHLYKTLGLKEDALVLDAGAGNGGVSIYMANKGLRMEAVELVDTHVENARASVRLQHMQKRVSISQGTYEDLSAFGDNTFDGAYTMETLVHAGEPDQAMREFYRVLKPGGVIVHVEYEHDMDDRHVGRKALAKVNEYSHMPAFEQFTLGTIRSRLEKTGFEGLEVQDLSLNIAPMMRFFFLLAYIPYLIVRLFGLEAYFTNTMAAVELWYYRDDIRYLMIKARKPSNTQSQADEPRRRLPNTG
ncbi:hypothetical protein MMC25_005343 [Agyrium rufum]|nr:hypothetical protein [Agyrium rufum]